MLFRYGLCVCPRTSRWSACSPLLACAVSQSPGAAIHIASRSSAVPSYSSRNSKNIRVRGIVNDEAGISGANGVILVNTKSGKTGSPQITADYFQDVTRFTKKTDLIDGVVYMNLANEASYTEFIRTRNTGTFSPRYSQDLINKTASGENPILYPNVDWLDQVFRITCY